MKSHYPRYHTSNEQLAAQLTESERAVTDGFLHLCRTTSGPSRVAKCHRYLLHFRDILEKPIDQVTKDDAIKFWGLVNNAPYSGHTKIDIRKVVRRFLKWHYRDYDMLEPLKVPSNFLVNKHRINKSTLLTQDELKRMLHQAERLRDKTLLILLYETAARPQEIRDLKWGDVNWEGAEIHLYSRKTKDDRDLPIGESLQHLKRWKEEWVFADPQESDYIFPSIVGSRHVRTKPISVEYINRVVKKLARGAGIERGVFSYLLRHTRLTEIRRRGVQGIEFNKFAGHRPGSKHEHVYVHMDNDDMKAAVIEKVYKVQELSESERTKLETRVEQLEQQLRAVLKFLQETQGVLVDLKA